MNKNVLQTNNVEYKESNKLPLSHRLTWRTFQGLIIALAVVLVFPRIGIGIIFPGMAFMVIALAIVSAIASCITCPLLRHKVTLFILICMASLIVGYTYYSTSPTILFRHYITDPIPASVRILNIEYQGGLDPAVYAHFEIHPDDFDAILQTHHYEIEENEKGPIGSEPVWWKPNSGGKTTLYHWNIDSKNDAWFWADETKSNIYFTYWNS